MFVRFFYHDDNATGFPVQTLRELSDTEYPLNRNQHPDAVEAELTALLIQVRQLFPEMKQQLFAVDGFGDNCEQIIGAEVMADHQLLTPMMRYLARSASHQIADAIENLSRE